MALSDEAILQLIRTVPPRCLQRFGVEPVSAPADWDHDLVTAWKLACPCGESKGEVLGHPLRDLKPGVEDSDLFVSPFSFQCSECGKSTPLFDTDTDGTGAELAKLEGSDIGCAAYRGEGPGQPYPCPKCATTLGEVEVALWFNEDYMYSLEEDGIEFPWENLFSGVHVCSQCSACGERSLVTDIDTKY